VQPIEETGLALEGPHGSLVPGEAHDEVTVERPRGAEVARSERGHLPFVIARPERPEDVFARRVPERVRHLRPPLLDFHP
jgi:hypothetical protein